MNWPSPSARSWPEWKKRPAGLDQCGRGSIPEAQRVRSALQDPAQFLPDRRRSWQVLRPGGRWVLRQGRLAFQKAAYDFSECGAALRPQALLQAAISLRSGEHVRHQCAKSRAALNELNHARRDGASEKTPAVEAPRNSRRKFEVGGKCFANPRWIFLGLARDQGFRQQVARSQRIVKALARDGVDPSGGIAHQRPVPPDDAS